MSNWFTDPERRLLMLLQIDIEQIAIRAECEIQRQSDMETRAALESLSKEAWAFADELVSRIIT